MRTKTELLTFLACLFFAAILPGCGGVQLSDSAQPKYLRNNIHSQLHQDELKASYANWTDPGSGHVIIPVNTPVAVRTVRRDLVIVTLDTNKSIYFEFDESRMGMTNAQYVDLITSPQPTSLDSLSALDRKGISEGIAQPGMTKEGVRTALGYPARHGTPSLQSNTWKYWKNRWKSFSIEFDSSGIVKKVNR